MGLCPTNMISKETTGQQPFPNVAGVGHDQPDAVDQQLIGELQTAGIEWHREAQRYGEPHTAISGKYCGWTFQRAWYYWMAKGPHLPLELAMPLHKTHGTSVRVKGHCGCPAPDEYCGDYGVDSYHVDNQEGLNALAAALKERV